MKPSRSTPASKASRRQKGCSRVITIVDYGRGNLYSVQKALERLKFSARISADPQDLLDSDGVILPGVGAFGDAMLQLRKAGLDETLWELSKRGTPLLGICLGMQLLFTESEENGLHRGLNLLPGTVRRLPQGVKIPHVGWNELRFVQPHPLFYGLNEGHVYFVHSYYAEVANQEDLLATTDYGGNIAALVGRHSVFGMQFHPEKSGDLGLQLLQNFARMCEKETV